MKTETFIDKTQWAVRGEWDSEPDKAEWIDPATGFVCLAVRNHSNWCGYVGVPPGHPAHGVDYDELRIGEDYPSVHGGLTFSGACQKEGHICHVPEPGQPDNVWWLGFDCAHSGDLIPDFEVKYREIEQRLGKRLSDPFGRVYRNLEYVREECRQLAAQLATCKAPPARVFRKGDSDL